MNTEPDTMRNRVLHELEHARRKRDHHAKFLDSKDPEIRNGSKSFFDKHEMDIACYEAYLNQSKRDTENGDLLDQLFEAKNKIRELEIAIDHLRETLGMNTPIPRDGTEVFVHLESNRHTTVKWDADMGLWEETCGDMAYPDCDIVRWAPLNWQCMPGTPGSEI